MNNLSDYNVPADWEPVYGGHKSYVDFEGDQPILTPGPLIGWLAPDGFISPDKLPEEYKPKREENEIPFVALYIPVEEFKTMLDDMDKPCALDEEPIGPCDIYPTCGGNPIKQVCDWCQYVKPVEDKYQAELSAVKSQLAACVEALEVAGQAFLEIKAARANGPAWFTKGVAGQQSHIETWLRKGSNAVQANLPATAKARDAELIKGERERIAKLVEAYLDKGKFLTAPGMPSQVAIDTADIQHLFWEIKESLNQPESRGD